MRCCRCFTGVSTGDFQEALRRADGTPNGFDPVEAVQAEQQDGRAMLTTLAVQRG
ncbi:hypothetical protein [Paracoccus mutanolyticus]|uniref:hypothetical protein n=1 Tax=Paracoccus mutanolyticus TaxID=1499308 RepID=UPI0016770B91|nr:hypothetical protein [Paracoccus mutanolyticus]